MSLSREGLSLPSGFGLSCKEPCHSKHTLPRTAYTQQQMELVLATQSCLTLCNPMECSPPGSSVHGIFQARILEWVAISFSRGSVLPRNQTQVSRLACRFFSVLATREAWWQIKEGYKGSTTSAPSRQH